jgi:hypothetical protein
MYMFVLVYLHHSYTFLFKILSGIYSECTVNIFSCLKLSFHDSTRFNPVVYRAASFCRVNIHLVSAFALCPDMRMHYATIQHSS